jgi:hypothetical protein
MRSEDLWPWASIGPGNRTTATFVRRLDLPAFFSIRIFSDEGFDLTRLAIFGHLIHMKIELPIGVLV